MKLFATLTDQRTILGKPYETSVTMAIRATSHKQATTRLEKWLWSEYRIQAVNTLTIDSVCPGKESSFPLVVLNNKHKMTGKPKKVIQPITR